MIPFSFTEIRIRSLSLILIERIKKKDMFNDLMVRKNLAPSEL